MGFFIDSYLIFVDLCLVMRFIYTICLCFVLPILLINGSGCGKASSKKINSDENLEAFAIDALNDLKQKDWHSFAEKFRDNGSIRFSPYSTVNVDKDITFEFGPFIMVNVAETEYNYTWGYSDGIGDPLYGNFKEYYLNTFIFPTDLTTGEPIDFLAYPIYVNNQRSTQNSVNNLLEVYPGADVVEFYMPGTDEYISMDWKSLKFVINVVDNKLQLLGVVSGRWTI